MRLIVAALLALGVCTVGAQTFPSKPLRVIVPQPPGGGFDMVARTVSEPLAALLGQSVIVENRPGGGTVIGTDAVAKAEPDGYTMLLGASANLAFTPGLYANLPYDPKRDFIPIGLAATFSYTLVARNDLPPRTLADIVGYARANPAKLNYASAGNGTGQHICAALSPEHLSDRRHHAQQAPAARAGGRGEIPARRELRDEHEQGDRHDRALLRGAARAGTAPRACAHRAGERPVGGAQHALPVSRAEGEDESRVKRIFLVTFLFSSPAWSVSPEAQEFIAITQQLEPVQCEKRQLRREIALAEVEQRDAKELGALEPRLLKSTDSEDLTAVSRQQRADFDRVVADREVATALEKRGARPLRMAPREAEAFVAHEIDKWTQLMREARITSD